jgi:hypothetical protein
VGIGHVPQKSQCTGFALTTDVIEPQVTSEWQAQPNAIDLPMQVEQSDIEVESQQGSFNADVLGTNLWS